MASPTSSRTATAVAAASVAATAALGGYAIYCAAGGKRRPHIYAEIGERIPEAELPLPAFVKLMFRYLPEWLLVPLLPGPGVEPANAEGVTGRPSHTFTRLNPRVLTVMHEFQTAFPDIKRSMLEYSDPHVQAKLMAAASNPQQMETDLQLVQRLAKLTPEAVAPGGALHEEGLTNILLRKAFMAVIKMEDGGLLLYNPVKLTPELAKRVETEMGSQVKWIVTGSAYHTTYMKGAATAFPNAQIVASTRAAIMLAKVGVKVDWDYTRPGVLGALAQQLASDFDLCYIPDPLCHPLLLLHRSSKLLLEVDLLYVKEDFHPATLSPGTVLSRLFWERNVIASANGILPTYRFPLFFGGFFPNIPQASETALEETLLALEQLIAVGGYDKVWSPHREELLDASDFDAWLQRAWIQWMKDPYSLIKG
mmetsp:Transcript_13943/g.24653  ORF Transcript_13943/g.24653 Transcript_13943/m.24653 type:complete len:423 (-) Transcript_13943:297-1565(-)